MACIAKRRNRYILDFYDSQGKRHWKTLPEGMTKAEAKDLLRQIESQVARGVYLTDKRIPTFAEVAKNWLEHKKPNLRQSTWEVYEGHTRNHFREFEHLKINRINTARVEKFITTRQKAGMNILTIRKVLVTLGQIFSYAVRHGLIESNPLTDAERPRGTGETEHKKIEILTPPELMSFLEAAKTRGQKYYTLFLIAVMTGARQGEILGLKWSDVNWETKQLHIQRSFNNQNWYTTKTKGSNRKIDIGPAVITELKKWRLACSPNELDLIFPNGAGQPINHSHLVDRHFEPTLKTAGLRRIRFHDLRHSFASLLIAQGENIKYIQSQLGHSSPSVTLNVYAHLINPTNQEAAFRLENAIFQTTGSKMVADKEKGVTA